MKDFEESKGLLLRDETLCVACCTAVCNQTLSATTLRIEG